jgi:hypothetical protein
MSLLSTEHVIRVFANATVSGLETSGEKIAHTGPPAATRDAVYAYLARVVVRFSSSLALTPLSRSQEFCTASSASGSEALRPATRRGWTTITPA